MSADRRYVQVALASLVVAAVAGTWIRASLLWPAVLGPIPYLHAVHAHSHLALFGWVTAGLMAHLVAGQERPRWFARHATLVGIASALSFVGFLRRGYDIATIALATAHVALWIMFVARTSRSMRGRPSLDRAAVAFLAIAGLLALLPGIASAMDASPALARLVVELFLTTLVGGWAFIGGAAMLLGRDQRGARFPLLLLAVGTIPSALARVAGVGGTLAALGRAGLVLTGVGSLLLAARMLEVKHAHPGARMLGVGAAACAVTKGGVELLAAFSPLAGAMYLRPAAVAYLHLVLLGAATSAMLVHLVAWAAVPRSIAVLHLTGLATMLLALAAMAAADMGLPMNDAGITMQRLQWAVLAGSVASAGALAAFAAATLRPAPGPIPTLPATLASSPA